jgi:hypothetical protein
MKLDINGIILLIANGLIIMLFLLSFYINFLNYHNYVKITFYNDKYRSGIPFLAGISGYLGCILGGPAWKQEWLSNLWWLPLVTDYIVFAIVLTLYYTVREKIQKSKQSK